MSDARIQELESQIGDLENEHGLLEEEVKGYKQNIIANENRMYDIDTEIKNLNDELNCEPFDEET